MSTSTFSTNQSFASVIEAIRDRVATDADSDYRNNEFVYDDEEYGLCENDPIPMKVDFSGGPNTPSKSIGERIDELCAVCDWRARWVKRGMICIPHEIKDLLVTRDPDVMGCGGWDHAGRLHWVGFDLDVGHGRDDLKYASRDEALQAALLIRKFVGDAAEIRASKSGNGIHVRVPIAGVETDGRKKAALIAKWLARAVNVKTDTAVLGRQNLFFWAREIGPHGFELLYPCDEAAMWTPPAEALEEVKPHVSTANSAAPGKACFGSDAISQCRRYLAKVPPAIQGQDGSGRCFHAACVAVIGFNLTPTDALTALADWNLTCKPPWSQKELEHKITDAGKRPDPRGKLLRMTTDDICPADIAEAFLDETKLRDQLGLRLRFHRGEFFEYNGTHYDVVPPSDFEARITKFLQNKPETRERAKLSLTNAVMDNLKALTLVTEKTPPPVFCSDPAIAVPTALSMTNGIIDLQKLIAQQPFYYAHTPNLFTLIGLPYAYDCNAKCPIWDGFLLKMFPDPDVRNLLQEWMGYNLVHDTSFEKFMILYGEGANGKSVFMTVFREVLGKGNYSALGLESFNPVRTFPLAATIGMLANIVSEIGEWDRSAEGILKAFVTGEPMSIERKYRDPFVGLPTARLTFATNTLPRFTDRTDALWRRLMLVPCNVQILDESKQDKRLVNAEFWRTNGELPGVFNWAVEGLRRLRQRGHFFIPLECQAAKTEYQRESNPARTFLEENYCAAPNGSMFSNAVYQQYHEWMEKSGQKPLGATQFGNEVKRAFKSATLSKYALRTPDGGRSRSWSGFGPKP